jgi:two-component system NarL family sensor kinase
MDIPEETREKSPDLFVRRDPDDVVPFIAASRSRQTSKAAKAASRHRADWDDELRIRLDERGRLARELHDSTSQLLVTLELQLMRLKQTTSATNSNLFSEILLALGDTISELHDEVRSLGEPSYLLPGGVGSELGAMATEFADRTGLLISTHFDRLPDGTSSEIVHTLFRVAQESLANASRHASPSNVSLDLNVDNDTATLRTIDDGVGFQLPPETFGTGHGLANMRSRVDQVGGKLKIKNLEHGAMIEATIPLGS